MSSHRESYRAWRTAISALDLHYRRTCTSFTKGQEFQRVSLQEQNDKCGCGRLKRLHSYNDLSESQDNEKWNSESCSTSIKDTGNFGILYNPYGSTLSKVTRVYFLFINENFSFRLVYPL